MSTAIDRQPTTGKRIVALLMILGGLAGLVGGVAPGMNLVRQHEFPSLPRMVIPSVLYACSVWLGWGLWQGKNGFLPWARLLFGLQVFFFSVGGIAYDFWVGLAARIAVDGWMIAMPPPSHSVSIGGNFGASFDLNLTRQDSKWMVGINLLALGVLIYLFRIPKVRKDEPSAVGNEPRLDLTN